MQEAKDLIARLLAKRLSRLDPHDPHDSRNDSFSQFQPVMSHESEVVPCSCKESERTNDVGRSVGSSLDCSELHRKRSCIKTPHDKFFDAFAK